MLEHVHSVSNMPGVAATEPELANGKVIVMAVGRAGDAGLYHMGISQDVAILTHYNARSPSTARD